jgi:predicted porin
MFHSFKPVAIATSLVFAAQAAAQSSVTLGGIADVAVRYVKNDGVDAAKSMVSGANQTSRLFLRGVEDLGGGLSAGFHLEHGIALNTGTQVSATQFWDRRATVSLLSKSLGEIRAGRDFIPSYTGWAAYDPFSYVGVAGSTNLISAAPTGPIRSAFGTNPNTAVRANDALQVLLPSGLGGLEGGLMLAPQGGGTVAQGKNRVIGLRLGWAAGPVRVSGAYTTTENSQTGDEKFKDAVVGGAYNFGPLRLSAAWRRFQIADAEQTNLMLGAVAPLGSGEVRLSWHKVDFDGSVGSTALSANGATQIGLGYVHNLSRRTALYATASTIGNDGALTLVIPGGSTGMAAGGRSKAFEAGVRHTF